MSQWYYDATSQWTLDYPPFFAWWEYFLSLFASFVDKQMLVVENQNYFTPNVLLFQRITVMFSDLVLLFSLLEFNKAYSKITEQDEHMVERGNMIRLLLVLLNCGLMFVDHVHFQYNGMLLGLLVLSISWIIAVLCSLYVTYPLFCPFVLFFMFHIHCFI
eukprot:TRINITY_DN11591_c0_g5_i5.p1 TRINITY_DN11591_c0_g5~~TRINITY_DN11591_c0_g5_i5.p1  ORF type:complete len:160 (-),score=18.46 TRINITY_DN11591_c0_g5_i5:224-703(-)